MVLLLKPSLTQSRFSVSSVREDCALAKIEHRLNDRRRRFARDEMSGDGDDAAFVALREVARVTRRALWRRDAVAGSVQHDRRNTNKRLFFE